MTPVENRRVSEKGSFVIRRLAISCAASLVVAAGSASAQANVAAVAHGSAHAVVHSTAAVPPLCAPDYYKNVNGACVHRPASDPSGATAKCRDGSYSYSRHASGTCSHHGGVLRWIHHP